MSAVGNQSGLRSEEPAAKKPRVTFDAGQDRELRNIIEFDGKSCSHEVAWPPGACDGYVFFTGTVYIYIYACMLRLVGPPTQAESIVSFLSL